MKRPAFITTLILSLTSVAGAQVYDWKADSLPGVKINTVAFKGWVPARAEPLRGTLVLIPGRHQDGRGMAGEAPWQGLANDLGFAIVACQFADGDPGLYQGDPQGGRAAPSMPSATGSMWDRAVATAATMATRSTPSISTT